MTMISGIYEDMGDPRYSYHWSAEKVGPALIVEIRTPGKRLVRLEITGKGDEQAALVYVEGKYHDTVGVESGEGDNSRGVACAWASIDELAVPFEGPGLDSAAEAAISNAVLAL